MKTRANQESEVKLTSPYVAPILFHESYSGTYPLDLQEIICSILKYHLFKVVIFLWCQKSHSLDLLDGPLGITFATHKSEAPLRYTQTFSTSLHTRWSRYKEKWFMFGNDGKSATVPGPAACGTSRWGTSGWRRARRTSALGESRIP